MLNFETDLDIAGKSRVVQRVTVPSVTTTTTVTALPSGTTPQPIDRPAPASEQASFVARDTDDWTWQDVRDYVVREIENRFGTFPRDVLKESGIFKSFTNRWGAQAGLIARAAFEVHDGYWKGAPISVNRFTKNSDPYFASVLADRL